MGGVEDVLDAGLEVVGVLLQQGAGQREVGEVGDLD